MSLSTFSCRRRLQLLLVLPAAGLPLMFVLCVRNRHDRINCMLHLTHSCYSLENVTIAELVDSYLGVVSDLQYELR